MSDKEKDASQSEKDQKDYKEKIKEMERKKREAAHKTVSAKPETNREVSFDEWYMMRSPMIPKIHRKEVLKADFKGRGLSNKAEIANYDEALEKYGVKLNK